LSPGKTLTTKEAFLAMSAFPEECHESRGDDAVAVLSSGLSLLTDGMPMDPAYWKEWQVAVDKAVSSKVDAAVRFQP